ncbi:MAG: hypothetical protein AAF805_09535 [Planctomycetota bacterium]
MNRQGRSPCDKAKVLERSLAVAAESEASGDPAMDELATAALRRRVLEAYDASRTAARPIAWNRSIVSLGRWMMARPVPRVGVPVAAIAMLAASLAMLRPTPGYALEQFVNALAEARSMSGRITASMKGQAVRSFDTVTQGNVWRHDVIGEDGQPGEVTIGDEEAGTITSIDHAGRSVRINRTINAGPDDKPEGDFVRFLVDRLRGVEDNRFEQESLGEEVRDGKRLVGFRVVGRGSELVLWGDPETGLPHSITSRMASFPEVVTTFSDIEFDTPIDDTTFDDTPPGGYAVTTTTMDLSLRTEAGLIKALRLHAEMSGGSLPETLDFAAAHQLLERCREAWSDLPEARREAKTDETEALVRLGFAYALMRPAEENAHWAGAGVKLGEASRPVFWRQPGGVGPWRVIDADLEVREADTPPSVPGAKRLGLPQQ